MKDFPTHDAPIGEDDPFAQDVRRDLDRLNAKHAGLGTEAGDYVLGVGGADVLSALPGIGAGDVLELGVKLYYSVSDATSGRRRLLVNAPPERLAAVARYAEVMAAAWGTAPCDIAPEDVPLSLRLLLHDVVADAALDGRGPNGVGPIQVTGLGAAHLPELAAALGASVEGLFAALYSDAERWHSFDPRPFRRRAGVRQALPAHQKAVRAALPAMTAGGRTALVEDLDRITLAEAPELIGALLDLTAGTTKKSRAAATATLARLPADLLERVATKRLASGNAAAREAMVGLLAGCGTESARATLEAHAEGERAARVTAAIGVALGVPPEEEFEGEADDETGYTAFDGTRIAIPPERLLPVTEPVPMTEADIAALRAGIERENARIRKWNAEPNSGVPFLSGKVQEHPASIFRPLILGFETGRFSAGSVLEECVHLLHSCGAESTIRAALARQGADRRLAYAATAQPDADRWFGSWGTDPFSASIADWAAGPDADLRTLERVWRDKSDSVWLQSSSRTRQRKPEPGDMLRVILPDETWRGGNPQAIAPEALWPYAAENLAVLDDAFDAAPAVIPLDPVRAMACIATLPKLPRRFVAPLLDIATGDRKTGRAEARALLGALPGLTERLVPLVEDGRQAIRAGAAEWLGQRGDAAAIPALEARLRKEKSDLARAALLSALRALGAPMEAHLGLAALKAEAEKGLKKAKLEPLGYLGLDRLPALEMADGTALPDDVLRWWLTLAVKLKQPGGNALFEIHLDQLAPASAAALGDWITAGWIAHDTEKPSEATVADAIAQWAAVRVQSYQRWQPGYTLADVEAEIRREVMSNYVNSGAATKGLLGLATRTPPALAAARVKAYLKAHGSRTSQATALLEMLAGMGDPVSLQVVVAAATRLKQKGVQARAGELVEAAAARHGWTAEELADRTIPACGLDDDGTMTLACAGGRTYVARLMDDLTLSLTNPDGKVVKALPAGSDDDTKAAKAQLTGSRKALKQVAAMQGFRLYEALCSGRAWAFEAWRRDLLAHPVMGRLAQRLIWQALDAEGAVCATFRPTPEGGFTDADDGDVDPSGAAAIRLAHAAHLDDPAAWAEHLADYEVAPLFPQLSRPLMRPEAGAGPKIEDRKGWMVEGRALQGVATKLGYVRGEALDGGFYTEHRKPFPGAGITAVIEFTGSAIGYESDPAALLSLSFVRSDRRPTPIPLDEVPEVLLSECWCDLHDMAAKGAHDPDWETRTAW